MDSYRDKIKSLGFVSKPHTKKVTPVHDEVTGRYGGYHTERGKPGSGVSEGIDATVQGGTIVANPNLKVRKVNAHK